MAPPSVAKRTVTASQLADLIASELATRWLGDVDEVTRQISKLTGSRAKWVRTLATSVNQQFGKTGHATRIQLLRWLRNEPHLRNARKKKKSFNVPVLSTTQPTSSLFPTIETDDQLVDFLQLPSLTVLDWLLVPHFRRQTQVDHYTRRVLRRRDGTTRLIEEPRPLLKRVQRLIHSEVLADVVIHDVAHAYRGERSVFTCAAPHVGHQAVLKMDLQNFFGTITLRRIAAQFRRCGFPRPIALTLGRLCTAPPVSVAPTQISNDFIHSNLMDREAANSGGNLNELRMPAHLPQGAPTSPTLANAVAFQLDRRLLGLANAVGANYTRYADDLFFSGDSDFASRIDRFATTVAVIAMEEGFTVAHRKTRKMFSGHRQQLLGLTVNEKLNSHRQQYEQLKAILTNCVRHGWESQNRENHPNFADHLRGRIAQTLQCNPNRGQRLMRLFHEIAWNETQPSRPSPDKPAP
ncbi:reverse transcriptase family protein [Rhodopirellula sp. SWK7]|uniref:reverse transcriptase family protein n=1 Tax=Rhodopirellula sp. SWK7 TaxID=595460 RepID=UPI0002BED314|nr:reverse transcriptase family protein [Rhodopirellula sp. SWK7]EMI44484.1 Retron-type reverse transcriptase [Rhodopirellula sp. SWK7]